MPQIHKLKMKIKKKQKIITDYFRVFLKIALAIFKSVIMSFLKFLFLICESVAAFFFESIVKFIKSIKICVALQGL